MTSQVIYAMSTLMNRIARCTAAFLLLGVGLFSIVGYVFDIKALRGIGMAAVLSPFPKVFSDVDGLEPYASDFTLAYTLPDGRIQNVQITPAFYQQLRGPYNRRNVYGAALSYSPRLPDEVWQAVYCHGFKEGGPLRDEFYIPAGAAEISMTIRTKTRGRADQWTLNPDCAHD